MDQGELKLAFIRKALEDYGRDVTLAMRRVITHRNVQDTGTLLASLSYQAYQQAADGNVNIDFSEWGRFIDMGVGRGHSLAGIAATKEHLRGKRAKKGSGRQPVKIYSPIAYGHLNGLIGDLLYGFTEETIDQLKTQLNANP